jgi:hypothetical protein
MNDLHRRRLEHLARSSAYVTANAVDFPEGSKGAQALAELNAAIAEAQSHAVSRETSVHTLQQATAARSDMRQAIRAGLRTINDTMRTIALDHPEHKGSFVFKGESVSDRTLLSTAQSCANSAQSFKALFNEYDLGAEFFDEFNDNISKFGQQMDKQTAGKGGRIAANASLESALRRGEEAFEKLDTAVRNKYRNDPAKLAAWESARRMERAARSRRRTGGKRGDDGANNVGGSETPKSGQS